MSTSVVRARVEDDVKEDAAAVLGELGLTVSDIIRMTLTRVARERAVPFELIAPNAKTQAAMKEGRKLIKARRARFSSADDHLNALGKAR
ncbi:MAG: type II toxin-antitoxin system RelB/DinJ family antitoxin [Parvibaculum sp.]|jgi:DNA-damage-inducible protein J|uniref:type II toxin-antitoxin system RelB/DinJ family antitoxin n=1 Tax=Parvibaculum sp. TaxID=2024848 RepID=UPI000CB265A9|nr:type II toxin-antitoxin system RelB/DinJ family antitoxin [Parvibaculum sp.]MDZ4380825.1 type II toxin-antitoxin system RelB/DinJ family antitoxin [Parvibaculum sp.]PKP78258.1 MAG: type II toxin-antitoxin system antitoxin, RelB/DinJ family [Alphaproteobacteria bacterium HGW-Alphaproteobacteria-3]PKP95865.1 MAG: type II toxin-antitoxin system antitoxin, RelB/DinJ family [Alphaproteobacteria bacterium HGW-Alphaproteobacteria-15]